MPNAVTEAAFLTQMLPRKLAASIVGVGVKDLKAIAEGVEEIHDETIKERLHATVEIAQMLLRYDRQRTVAAWFVSPNPHLGLVSPGEALNSGRLREVRRAAETFILTEH